jgi:predicted ferric reductase
MNEEIWWYLARATGIIAWALLAGATIWGLLLTTRILARRPQPKWLLDLHRFLGGLALIFTGLHLATLLADDYVDLSVLDLAVPFASDWKPGPVAAGVVALYLLFAIETSSLAMRHIPRRWWRSVHLGSYALYWLATGHTITAGTDATHRLLWWTVTLTSATVAFLSAYRVLVDRSARRVPRHPARPQVVHA